jgi:hypothetical protein
LLLFGNSTIVFNLRFEDCNLHKINGTSWEISSRV